MFIEENNAIVNIGRKEVEAIAKKLYGANFSVTDRPLMFKLHPELFGVDEDGRILAPKRYGVLPNITTTESDGSTRHVRYYTSKTGKKDQEIYNPQSVYFADGEITIDLSGRRGGAPDFALAYLLLQHPKLMKNSDINTPGSFYLYRADQEAASKLEMEELKAAVDNYILYKQGRDYIKDEELESACRRVGISVTGTYSMPELRNMLLTKARSNPEDFLVKIRRDGRFYEVVQKALDMKVIAYNETKGEYCYVYRPEEGIYNKKKINSTEFYKVPPHGRVNPIKNLVDYLVNDDQEGHLSMIEQGVNDEIEMLQKHPAFPGLKDKNKALMKMIADIVVE